MKMNWILSTAFMAVAISAAGSAQAGKDKPSTGDMMRVTYTGCVEAVNHGGTFLLTHAADTATSMHAGETMKSDAGMMKEEHTAMDEAKAGNMAPRAIVLAGSNLRRHVGQKVSVTGSLSPGSMGSLREDVSTLTIKTLKVVARSCSPEMSR